MSNQPNSVPFDTAMTIVDSKGKRLFLSDEQEKTALQCDLIKKICAEINGNNINFDQVSANFFKVPHQEITQANYFESLFEFMNHPENIKTLDADTAIQLLKLADYLEAPESILKILSILVYEHLRLIEHSEKNSILELINFYLENTYKRDYNYIDIKHLDRCILPYLKLIAQASEVENMRYLTLQDCGIAEYDLSSILKLFPSLRVLDLSENNIIFLKKDHVVPMPPSFQLILDGNPIQGFETECFNIQAYFKNAHISLKNIQLSPFFAEIFKQIHDNHRFYMASKAAKTLYNLDAAKRALGIAMFAAGMQAYETVNFCELMGGPEYAHIAGKIILYLSASVASALNILVQHEIRDIDNNLIPAANLACYVTLFYFRNTSPILHFPISAASFLDRLRYNNSCSDAIIPRSTFINGSYARLFASISCITSSLISPKIIRSMYAHDLKDEKNIKFVTIVFNENRQFDFYGPNL